MGIVTGVVHAFWFNPAANSMVGEWISPPMDTDTSSPFTYTSNANILVDTSVVDPANDYDVVIANMQGITDPAEGAALAEWIKGGGGFIGGMTGWAFSQARTAWPSRCATRGRSRSRWTPWACMPRSR